MLPARRPRRSTSATPSARAAARAPRRPTVRRSRRRRSRLPGRRSRSANRLAPPGIGERSGRGLVQHEYPCRPMSRTCSTSSVVDTTPLTDGMCARRDCLAAERATARQRRRPLSTRACPSQRATQRAACHATNASAPGLGGQLDGQLGAVRLRQRLHDGDGRRGRGDRRGSSTRAVRRPLPTSSMTHARPRPRRRQVELLAGPDPPHIGGVETLVAVDHGELTHSGQRVDIEERARICARSSATGENVSRSRLNSPPPCEQPPCAERTSAMSRLRLSFSLRNNSMSSWSSRDGTTTSTWACRSPRTPDRRCGMP